MEALEERIYRDGHFLPGGILKVDSFVNHQVDTRFMMEVGHEVARLQQDCHCGGKRHSSCLDDRFRHGSACGLYQERQAQYYGGLLQYPLPLIH